MVEEGFSGEDEDGEDPAGVSLFFLLFCKPALPLWVDSVGLLSGSKALLVMPFSMAMREPPVWKDGGLS